MDKIAKREERALTLDELRDHRRQTIRLAQMAYDGGLDHDMKIRRLFRDYSQFIAQNAFSRSDFKAALKFCTNEKIAAIYKLCAKAFQNLNAPMCDCVEIDTRTGQSAEPKADLQFSYLPKESKAVVYVLCAKCEEVFAVTVDNDQPLHPNELPENKQKTLKAVA